MAASSGVADGVVYVSGDDPRVEVYRDVKDRDVLGRGEWFILEGENSIANLMRHGRFPLVSVCISSKRVGPMKGLIEALRAASVPVYAVPQDSLQELVGFHFHRGVLGCGRRLARKGPDELLQSVGGGDASLIVLAENVTNLDNVGSIFRNAAAFGVDAVLLDETSSDPYYRKSIRVSGGHALVVPFSHAGTIGECVQAAKDHGYAVLALLTPGTDKCKAPVAIADFLATAAAATTTQRHATGLLDGNKRTKVALLLGAEGPGLSQVAVDLADARCTIPMVDNVDSLNVATACAVALYELSRTSPRLAPKGGRPSLVEAGSSPGATPCRSRHFFPSLSITLLASVGGAVFFSCFALAAAARRRHPTS